MSRAELIDESFCDTPSNLRLSESGATIALRSSKQCAKPSAPAERDLKDVVQLGARQAGRYAQPTPNTRLHIEQRDMEDERAHRAQKRLCPCRGSQDLGIRRAHVTRAP
jgi:hypothetical protein